MKLKNSWQFIMIPMEVIQDKSISSTAKLLYGIIVSLTQKEGFCSATNGHFSKVLGISPESISRQITLLEKCNYINLEYGKGNRRHILIPDRKGIDENVKRSIQKRQEVLTKTSRGIDENIKAISIYNSIENKIERDARASFEKISSKDQLKSYLLNSVKTGYWKNFIEQKKITRKTFDAALEKFCQNRFLDTWNDSLHPLNAFKKSLEKETANGLTKFPDKWDPQYDRTLTPQLATQYRGHLMAMGYTKKQTPGGTCFVPPSKLKTT